MSGVEGSTGNCDREGRANKKRVTGSRRQRHKKHLRFQKWHSEGIKLASVNMAGLSYFKLFLVLERLDCDILCLQETWLS